MIERPRPLATVRSLECAVKFQRQFHERRSRVYFIVFFYSFPTKFTLKLRNALRECKFAAFFQLFCIPKFQFRLLRSDTCSPASASSPHIEPPYHPPHLCPLSSSPIDHLRSPLSHSFPLSLSLEVRLETQRRTRVFGARRTHRRATRRPRRPPSPSSLCVPRRVQARRSLSRSLSLSLSPSVVFAASRRIQQHA